MNILRTNLQIPEIVISLELFKLILICIKTYPHDSPHEIYITAYFQGFQAYCTGVRFPLSAYIIITK